MISDADLDHIASFRHDPLGYVRQVYPWGEPGELAKHPGPRAWQADILDAIGKHLRDPKTRHKPKRIAVASGHGIGKSGLISMLIKWGLDTAADTRVVVTANTDNQLRTKTWPEVVKWQRLADTRDWFKETATAIYQLDAEKSWRADAIPWSENNTEAFAGLHNEGNRLILIMDEGSAIADKVWEVSEGALTDANTEILWLVFGNPTRNTGRFRECFRQYRHLWDTRQIDSRTVEGTNKDYLDEMVATYGEDSDIVKVRIRGMFPSASAKQFISTDDVDAAIKRHLRPDQYEFAPKILTCDPAWEGDDMLEIGLRQGLTFRILRTIPKNDNDLQVAAILAQLEDEHQADAVFIDNGYGTGIISAGRTMGRSWIGVWFGAEAPVKGFANLRAYMWDQAKQWLKQGGAIDPKDTVLYQDLIGPETVATMDGKVQLESKKDMKKRGIPSPGRGDALALSFAFPVSKKNNALARNGSSNARRGYNPMKR